MWSGDLLIPSQLPLLSGRQVHDLPAVTDKIRERRMKIAGHCIRHPDILASSLVLWEPLKGKRSRGRPRVTFLDNLRKDTNLQDTREIKKAMEDKFTSAPTVATTNPV
ncbi:hypothetical protein Bbelb_210380 [Branchiostoma belcheri]|nr:hypothetical protein Bbelb_210380 [Branchiostoma belcheri]